MVMSIMLLLRLLLDRLSMRLFFHLIDFDTALGVMVCKAYALDINLSVSCGMCSFSRKLNKFLSSKNVNLAGSI